MDKIRKLLREHNKHGDYRFIADTAQRLKEVLHKSTNWQENLNSRERESIDMICTKLARWLHGHDGENRIDTQQDIMGYVALTMPDEEEHKEDTEH